MPPCAICGSFLLGIQFEKNAVMNKNLLRILLCALQCRHDRLPAGASEFTEADKKLTFAIIYANIHPFFDAIGQGAEDTIAKEGLNAEMILQEPAKRRQHPRFDLKDLITRRWTASRSTCDSKRSPPASTRPWKPASPVLCFDTDAPNSKRVGYVGTDNYEALKLTMGVIVRPRNPKHRVEGQRRSP